MQAKLSSTRACQIADLSRAAYYKRPTPASERDALVIDALNAIVTRHGRWGFWKAIRGCGSMAVTGIKSAFIGCTAIWA